MVNGKRKQQKDNPLTSKVTSAVRRATKVFLAFQADIRKKAALIKYAVEKSLSISDVGRQMIDEFIEKHNIEVPSEETAIAILAEFSRKDV